jgi:hypothetical protein
MFLPFASIQAIAAGHSQRADYAPGRNSAYNICLNFLKLRELRESGANHEYAVGYLSRAPTYKRYCCLVLRKSTGHGGPESVSPSLAAPINTGISLFARIHHTHFDRAPFREDSV